MISLIQFLSIWLSGGFICSAIMFYFCRKHYRELLVEQEYVNVCCKDTDNYVQIGECVYCNICKRRQYHGFVLPKKVINNGRI